MTKTKILVGMSFVAELAIDLLAVHHNGSAKASLLHVVTINLTDVLQQVCWSVGDSTTGKR